MDGGHSFSEEKLSLLRAACCQDLRVAAIYAFDLRQRGDYNLAALFTESLDWPTRLDLEGCIAKALGLDSIELIDLRRMPLVTRHHVVNRGKPLYVGDPEALAVFIEGTVVRYSAFYPLLEALYWQVETKPLAEDMLNS